MKKVLIDTDPGADDALAIMMAVSSSDLLVQGITTVGGNATLADTTRNALRVMEYLGIPGVADDPSSTVPVSRGAARPLEGKFHYGYYFHGAAGLGVRLPSPRSRPYPVPAADFIVESVSAAPGQVTLVALGPVTNVARALTVEPRLAGWVAEVVVMGGAVEVPGNVTPYAEFNTYNDPEAADIVLSSGAPVTLVGLDVCTLTRVERGDLPWVPGHSRAARLANRILANWFHTHRDRPYYDLCDPLAMAAVIRPDLLTFRQASVRVETEREERGRTVASFDGGPVRVAVDVNVDGANQLIRRLIAD